jgi:replicative DNA helicase
MAEPLPHGVVPPHSDEAEQAVLGALLADNRVFDALAGAVQPGHFYRPDYRAIFGTMAALVAASKPVDALTVHEAGGHPLADLVALSQGIYSERHARHYAEILLERWRERECLRIGMQMADEARRCGADFDADAVIARAMTALLALHEGRAGEREPRHVSELGMGFVDYVTDVYEGRIKALGTGLEGLDRLTAGGGRDGELWVIGARPSMGKTALTNTLARNMATAERASLFLSQEDSLHALLARHVASLGRVNLADIRNPQRAPQNMWDGLSEGVHQLLQLNMWLDDEAGLSLADVRRKVQRCRRKGGLGLVVIDYLQLMQGEGANRNIELGLIANGLKRLAKEEQVLIILLSQMNREADRRGGPPIISDLRDSGDIEGAADVIGLLWRPYSYWKSDELKRYAELIIAKCKNGPTGSCHLDFDGAFQRFGDWVGKVPSWQDAKRRPASATADYGAGGMD